MDSSSPLATLVPYKNKKALAAYYCGVFALIPVLGLLLGPVALLFGIQGRAYGIATPEAKGVNHALAGIILGGLTSLLNYGVMISILVARASR